MAHNGGGGCRTEVTAPPASAARLLSVTPVVVLEGHSDRVWHAAWHPRRDLLATCSSDRTVRIWHPRRGGGGAPTAAAASASWDCVGIVDDFTTRTVRWCAWSPNGKYLAVTSFDGKAYVWALTTGSGFGAVGDGISNPSRTVSSGEEGGGGSRDVDMGVGGRRFEEDASPSASGHELSLELMATLDGHENEVKGCAWNGDGTLLATCGRDKSVWLWSLDDATGDMEVIAVLHGHSQDVKAVVWHPTRPLLLSCSYDDCVKVWAESDGDWVCTDTLLGHDSTVWDMALTPDGSHLITVSDDCSAMVWSQAPATGGYAIPDLITYRRVATLPHLHARTIFTVDWAPEGPPLPKVDASMIGGLVASGAADDAVHIFALTRVTGGGDGEAGRATEGESRVQHVPCATLPCGHGSDVNCVRWHPRNPHILATVGDDNKVRLWQVAPATTA